MKVTQVGTGLWCWTTYHDDWGEDVGCVYCETQDGPEKGAVLVDPLVPGDEAERFWEALDRDVERVGGEVHVLVTVFWHTRSTAAVVERYGARVWAPTRGRPAIERRVGVVTDAYRDGDRLPGGIEAFRTARAAEVVFWIPEHRALVPGDVLLGDGNGGLRLCPPTWLPASSSVEKVAESLRPLLDLPVERVLVSHGVPVLDDARSALETALQGP